MTGPVSFAASVVNRSVRLSYGASKLGSHPRVLTVFCCVAVSTAATAS